MEFIPQQHKATKTETELWGQSCPKLTTGNQVQSDWQVSLVHAATANIVVLFGVIVKFWFPRMLIVLRPKSGYNADEDIAFVACIGYKGVFDTEE
ncbi:MAG: hypothetical protein BWY63_03040 [Chloroflexi bacterium ADurb.Bin360]|nr:MAG: hypothetical protein BWY63_03040 [Chloroflexi bacterium ADurb.Bin360]